MIEKFVLAWEKNKANLEEHFRTHKQDEYCSYESLVKLVFDIIINPAMEYDYEHYDTEDIHVIDDGDYQGTQIFLIHRNTYQPDICEYVYTHTYYGSCSGCDTLLSISGYGGELPDKKQIEDYMTLCLHLLQRCTAMTEGEKT